MLFPILGPSSRPIMVAQPGEGHATEQLLCWSGMTDTEHTTTGSNEEDQRDFQLQQIKILLAG